MWVYSWHDQKVCERRREIVMKLNKREKFLYGHVQDLKNEVKLLKSNAVEFLEGEILEETLILNKEVGNLNMQLK
ncbi:hypothetical protein REPUB_Repub07fG0089600 [Reevesia pubescens]